MASLYNINLPYHIQWLQAADDFAGLRLKMEQKSIEVIEENLDGKDRFFAGNIIDKRGIEHYLFANIQPPEPGDWWFVAYIDQQTGDVGKRVALALDDINSEKEMTSWLFPDRSIESISKKYVLYLGTIKPGEQENEPINFDDFDDEEEQEEKIDSPILYIGEADICRDALKDRARQLASMGYIVYVVTVEGKDWEAEPVHLISVNGMCVGMAAPDRVVIIDGVDRLLTYQTNLVDAISEAINFAIREGIPANLFVSAEKKISYTAWKRIERLV